MCCCPWLWWCYRWFLLLLFSLSSSIDGFIVILGNCLMVSWSDMLLLPSQLFFCYCCCCWCCHRLLWPLLSLLLKSKLLNEVVSIHPPFSSLVLAVGGGDAQSLKSVSGRCSRWQRWYRCRGASWRGRLVTATTALAVGYHGVRSRRRWGNCRQRVAAWRKMKGSLPKIVVVSSNKSREIERMSSR